MHNYLAASRKTCRILTPLFLACLLQGCGHLTLSLRTVFSRDGSCERTVEMIGEGAFREPLDDQSVDDAARKDGWSVRTYREGDAVRKVITRKFAASQTVTFPPSTLLQTSRTSPAKSETYSPDVRFTTYGSFPYRYCQYIEAIKPSPELDNDRCSVCDGTGSSECFVCGGRGQNECPVCNGTGSAEYVDTAETCSTCNGSGILECSTCSGSGKNQCQACNGTGRPGEMQRSAEKMAEGMVTIKNEVQMPGSVTFTNADRSAGSSLSWDITLDRMRTGIVMRATSRELNWTAVRLVIAVTVGLVALAVFLVRRSQVSQRTFI